MDKAAAASDLVPPYDPDAESSVLGAVLVNNEVLVDILPLLDAGCFYRRPHQIVFQAMADLYDRRQPIDFVTLKDELLRQGVLEELGGPEWLVTLAEGAHTSAHAKAHAQIVKDKWILRRLQQAAHAVLADVAKDADDPHDLLDRAEQRIFDISKDRRGDATVAIKNILHDVFAQIERVQARGSRLIGLSTGFYALDELLNGLQNDQLIIVAGRPSIGKTTFALNMVENIAVKQSIPVLIFSLEMNQSQIAENLLCMHARIDAHKLRQGRLSDADFTKLSLSAGKVAESQIYIDDTPSLSIAQLRAKARYVKHRHGIQLVMVDYLQMLEGGRARAENRQQEITEVTRSLKIMARELSLPVVALSQLRRAAEEREGHRPRLSDLRESGSIEQDADVVMFLNREDYYDREKNPGVVELDVAKQRNGPTDLVKLAFLRQFMKFENLAAQKPQEVPF